MIMCCLFGLFYLCCLYCNVMCQIGTVFHATHTGQVLAANAAFFPNKHANAYLISVGQRLFFRSPAIVPAAILEICPMTLEVPMRCHFNQFMCVNHQLGIVLYQIIGTVVADGSGSLHSQAYAWLDVTANSSFLPMVAIGGHIGTNYSRFNLSITALPLICQLVLLDGFFLLTWFLVMRMLQVL